jgi:hypothetical protein
VGKFCRPVIKYAQVEAATFKEFAEPGFAKTIYALGTRPTEDGKTLLWAIMRTASTDEPARTWFRRYWTFGVGYGAHVLVHGLLDVVHEDAERWQGPDRRPAPPHARPGRERRRSRLVLVRRISERQQLATPLLDRAHRPRVQVAVQREAARCPPHGGTAGAGVQIRGAPVRASRDMSRFGKGVERHVASVPPATDGTASGN